MNAKFSSLFFLVMLLALQINSQDKRTNQLGIGIGLHSVKDTYSSNFSYTNGSPVVAWESERYRPQEGRVRKFSAQYQYTRFTHPILSEREQVQFTSHRAVVNYDQLWNISNQKWFVGFNVSVIAHARLNDFLANGGSVYDVLGNIGLVMHYRHAFSNNHQIQGVVRLPIAGLALRPEYAYSTLNFHFASLYNAIAPQFQVNYDIPMGNKYLGVGWRGEYYRLSAENNIVYNLTNNLLFNYKF